MACFLCDGSRGSGIPKGFGFLGYEDQRSTILAVDNANGMKLLQRTLRVDHCKDFRPPTSGKDGDVSTSSPTGRNITQNCAQTLRPVGFLLPCLLYTYCIILHHIASYCTPPLSPPLRPLPPAGSTLLRCLSSLQRGEAYQPTGAEGAGLHKYLVTKREKDLHKSREQQKKLQEQRHQQAMARAADGGKDVDEMWAEEFELMLSKVSTSYSCTRMPICMHSISYDSPLFICILMERPSRMCLSMAVVTPDERGSRC